MKANLSKCLFTAIALLFSVVFVQGAKADVLDFSCGGASPCTGTVTTAGSNFSGAGIVLGSSFESDPFTLTFDTSTSTITLEENSLDQFIGTISGFSSTSVSGFTDVNLAAIWTTIPTDVGGNAGITPLSSIISLDFNNGSVYSADLPIVTPEPSTLMLLGIGLVGLVGLGLYPKRRAVSLA